MILLPIGCSAPRLDSHRHLPNVETMHGAVLGGGVLFSVEVRQMKYDLGSSVTGKPH